jgi:hypothetical protein
MGTQAEVELEAAGQEKEMRRMKNPLVRGRMYRVTGGGAIKGFKVNKSGTVDVLVQPGAKRNPKKRRAKKKPNRKRTVNRKRMAKRKGTWGTRRTGGLEGLS